MASSPLPRHRGTWSTVLVILIFGLGVCTVVFGIFNLAMNALLGVSALALGIGLIIPGVWWLRWYQKPQILRGLIPLSLVLLIPGTVGTALSAGTGNPTSETEPTVASSSPSSTASPTPSSVVPETSPATPSATAETDEPSTTVVEPPETVTVTLIPEPVEPAPVTITQILPRPVDPAPEVSPEPVDPVEVPDPEVPPADAPEAPGGENPVLEPEPAPAPTPTPAPAPANPWQGLVDQLIR